jgi:hypothetical protein
MPRDFADCKETAREVESSVRLWSRVHLDYQLYQPPWPA